MLLHSLLHDGARRFPDKVAFHWVDRSRSLTYLEAVEHMEAYAGAFASLGVRKGDRVTIVAHNGMNYLMSLFGSWRLGAIAALVNVKFVDELDYYFADHEPTLVVYTHDIGPAVRKAAAQVKSIRALLCMDGPQEGALSLPDLIAARHKAPDDPRDEDAIAHLSYTSGTTGRPKGACLAHEPTMRASRCIAERLGITSGDRAFGPTALSSSYQLVANLLPALHVSASISVMGRWTAETGWTKLDEGQASVFVANPTFLTDVLVQSRLKGRPPSGLRMGLSGGGPVSQPLKKAWRDELQIPLVESYGQSELGGFVALGAPRLQPDARLMAIGRPLPDKEVRVLDSRGLEVPVGGIGELCLRGGYMKGYWGKPEKTAEATRGGWLHTGDAGVMDAEGYITLRGRFSEVFSVAGATWFPRDVEEALASYPGVLGAALVGLPDAALGSRPKAFVVTEAAAIDEAALKAHVQGLVAYDLSSLCIARISEFPMTPTGKIGKADLLAMALAGRLG